MYKSRCKIDYRVATLSKSYLSNSLLDKSLKLSKEDCISNWNKNNLHAHTILLTQFSFKLLQNAGQETNFISDFLEFLITQ